jgi:membrane associated rhomboid family serine protease
MHGSILHLLGNMLFLWIFGNNIEDYLGKLKFIIFYLLAGIGASLAHVLFNWNSITPVIGASGAISGIMGAYLILYPKAKVRTLVFLFIFITFIDLPAYLFLIIWFVFQFASPEGVAWLAHVGGFIVGIFLIKLFRDREKHVIEFIE